MTIQINHILLRNGQQSAHKMLSLSLIGSIEAIDHLQKKHGNKTLSILRADASAVNTIDDMPN